MSREKLELDVSWIDAFFCGLAGTIGYQVTINLWQLLAAYMHGQP